jgi:hypothetical protein
MTGSLWQSIHGIGMAHPWAAAPKPLHSIATLHGSLARGVHKVVGHYVRTEALQLLPLDNSMSHLLFLTF